MTDITAEDAQRLINNLDDILGDRENLFRAAYELGFNAGHQVGHTLALHEEEQSWARFADIVRGMGTSDGKSFQETEQRRWGGPRDQFGQPRPGDHPGGPVDYDTGEPTATATAQPELEPAPRDPWATLPGAAA